MPSAIAARPASGRPPASSRRRSPLTRSRVDSSAPTTTPRPKIGQKRSSQRTIGHGLARDHRQEGRGDDVAEAGQAVGERQQRDLARRPSDARPSSRSAAAAAADAAAGRAARSNVPARPLHGEHEREARRRSASRSPRSTARPPSRCANRPLTTMPTPGPANITPPMAGAPQPRQRRQAPAGGVDEHARRWRRPQRSAASARRAATASPSPGSAGRSRRARRAISAAAPSDGSRCSARPDPGLERAQQRAEQVAEVVGAGEPARGVQVERRPRPASSAAAA